VGTRELIKHSLNAFKVMPRLSEYYTRQTFFEACKALNGWLESNSDNIIVKGISNFVNVTEQRQVYEQLIKEYGFKDKLTIDKSIGTLLEDFNLVKKGGTLEVAKVDMDSIKASWEIIKDKNVFGSQEIYADFVTNYRERVLALAKEEMPKAAEGFIANRVKNVQVQELFIKLAKKDPHKMMAIFDKARALHGDVVGMIAKRGVGEEAEELAFKEFSTIFKEILGNPKAEAELIKGMVGTLEKTSIVQTLYNIISINPFTLLGTTVMPGFGTIIGKIADEILYFALLSVPMTYFERYFDDQYALEMSLLSYRGQEFSAGINGHGLNNVCFKMNTPDDLDIFNTYEAEKKKFLKNDKSENLKDLITKDTQTGFKKIAGQLQNIYLGINGAKDIKDYVKMCQQYSDKGAVITSVYYDTRQRTHGIDYHYGYDIALPEGAKAIAGWSGVVDSIIPWDYYGYNTDSAVRVKFSNGSVIDYGHIIPSSNIKIGSVITPGTVVGTVFKDHVDMKMRDSSGNFVDWGKINFSK
jgi:murein DD-endopeptidase MepM/ murein hydrolase activator NlpD